MRELPPDHRPDLGDFLRAAEPVKPRHQRSVQARGDRPRRGGNSGQRLHGFQLTAGLEHRLGHLLNEQWDAVGALDNVLSDPRR
jgi:hypothetical protein